jgi:hypothetical protein
MTSAMSADASAKNTMWLRKKRHRKLRWKLQLGLALLTACSGCATWGTGDACRHCLPQTAMGTPPKAAVASTRVCTERLPHSAIPMPPGSYVNAWQEAMTDQAALQHFLVTRNLWYAGGNQLGPEGRQRMLTIAQALECCPTMVWIEEEPVEIEPGQSYQQAVQDNLRLNEERRMAVVETLTGLGYVNADGLVAFSQDRSVGTRGVEAPMIFNRQFMGGMGRRGGMGGGMGGFGGGMGGFGGGMGGFGGGMGGFGGGMGGGMGGFF